MTAHDAAPIQPQANPARLLRVASPGLMPFCCHLPLALWRQQRSNLRRFDNGAAQR
jgi:hypothetical protein